MLHGYIPTVNSRTRTISVACYILLRVLFIYYISVAVPSQLLYYYFRPSSKLTFRRILRADAVFLVQFYNTGKSRLPDRKPETVFSFFYIEPNVFICVRCKLYYIIILHPMIIIIHSGKSI